MKLLAILLFLTIVYVINAGLSNSSVVRKLKGGRDRLREFLKYDVECNWLTLDELAIRVSQGRCPPQTTTVTPVTYEESYFKRRKKAKKEKRLKKIKGIFSHSKKKKFLMVMSMGQQNLDELDALADHEEYRLLAGTMLQVTCNAANRSTNGTDIVSWFVNGRLIEPALLDWRVSIGEKGDLSVYPVSLDDGGNFECFVNNQYEGSITIVVITRTEAIVDGILNYLIVAACFIVVLLFAVVLINGTASRPPQPSLRNDKMTQFLEEHVLKNGQEARENIAKVVYGRDLDKRRAVVEESKRDGRSQRGNKDTIMTILQPPKVLPSGVVIGLDKVSLRKRRSVLPRLPAGPPPNPAIPVAPPPFVDPSLLPPPDPFFAAPVSPAPDGQLPAYPELGVMAPAQMVPEHRPSQEPSAEKVKGSKDRVPAKKSKDTVAGSKDTVANKKSKDAVVGPEKKSRDTVVAKRPPQPAGKKDKSKEVKKSTENPKKKPKGK